ncbi:hypothetical protein ACHAW5_002016 [Stephanodiscus triporus]|uniref:4-hydroxyphenylpyruvate dioxygenase n=1 Tax=Stephanodiscus triporus TaxID=2934178 RepID=A0ABD3MRK2_9STRA
MAGQRDGPNDGDATEEEDAFDIKFSHVQLYVDRVLPVREYEELEAAIAKFHDGDDDDDDDRAGASSSSFATHGRDVVRQLIAGLGFRVTGRYPESDAGGTRAATRSVLVTSSDPDGARILVTSLGEESDADGRRGGDESHDHDDHDDDDGRYLHFDPSNVRRFYDAHRDRQGVAVLAFEVGPGLLDRIFGRYSELHPGLIPEEYAGGARAYENEARVFEAYAYYVGDKLVTSPDRGTRLRFVEPDAVASSSSSNGRGVTIPGLVPVVAEFLPSCSPAYFDHWVSNVVSRTGFVDTLKDVLSFAPRVDFNAGVVAAGEAQIESTVVGNASDATIGDADSALRDRSQIYLPINNALTEVGHVHGFLKEIGQGVQHVASRVDDIVDFVQRANDRRRIFGEGFTFLSIPRSYYGILTEDMLVKGVRREDAKGKGSLSPDCAGAVYDICARGGLLHEDSSLALDATEDSITMTIDSMIPALHREEYDRQRVGTVETILHSRYVNLYNLLRDHLSEESYVAIVRNQILVDVQGEDLLFQIFTSNILQRESGEEAPFFEFIQRVCSECIGPDGCPKKLKPGCGGFGIRNFLTLFLSIEVTKAIIEASNARASDDVSGFDLFTEQLNESNPLLTEISDAMTKEGAAREKIAAYCRGEEKEEDGERWKLIVERESLAKTPQ